LARPIRRARMAMLCPCVRVFRTADDGMASAITVMMIILHKQRLHLHAVLRLALYPRNVLLGDGVPCAHVLLHAGREASLLALGQRRAGLGDAALEAVLVEFLGARSAGVLQRAKHKSDWDGKYLDEHAGVLHGSLGLHLAHNLRLAVGVHLGKRVCEECREGVFGGGGGRESTCCVPALEKVVDVKVKVKTGRALSVARRQTDPCSAWKGHSSPPPQPLRVDAANPRHSSLLIAVFCCGASASANRPSPVALFLLSLLCTPSHPELGTSIAGLYEPTPLCNHAFRKTMGEPMPAGREPCRDDAGHGPD
jgi:hypothetical protein